jgi:hypothetical protein
MLRRTDEYDQMSPWKGNIGPFLHAHDSHPRTAAAEGYFFNCWISILVRVIITSPVPSQCIIA